MLILQARILQLSFYHLFPHTYGGYLIMSETTKEQIQQSMAAYAALLKHINRWLFPLNFGGIDYMNMKKNLIRSMQTIGQMRAVIGE